MTPSSFSRFSGGLTNWSEAYNTATQTSSSFSAIGSATDIAAIIAPKGTGALIAQIPNGLASGGNARGAYAVDLQRERDAASRVASGLNSVIGGGYANTASAVYAAICGGAGNMATQNGSFIGGGASNTVSNVYGAILGGASNIVNGAYAAAFGNVSTADADFSFAWGNSSFAGSGGSMAMGGGRSNWYNSIAQGAGRFAAAGDRQNQRVVVFNTQTNVTGATAVNLTDTAGNELVPRGTNRAFNATISIVAVCTVAGGSVGLSVGDIFTDKQNVAFKIVSNVVSIVGTNTSLASHTDTGMSTSTLTVTATSGVMRLTYTCPNVASGASFRITGTVDVTEVAW